MSRDYPSCICNNCPATMYGQEDLPSYPAMSCEGRGCEQAYTDYYKSNPEKEKLPIDELF